MNTTHINKTVIAAVAMLCAANCYAKVVGDTIATVNGEPVLMSEYKKNVESVTEQYKRQMPDFFQQKDAQSTLEKKVLDQMIDDVILAQQADKEKIKVKDRDVTDGIGEVKKRFSLDANGKPLADKEAEALFMKELQTEGLNMEQFKEKIKKQLMVRKYIEETIRPRIKKPEETDVKKLFDEIRLVIKGDTSTLSGMTPMQSSAIIGIAQRLKDASSERVRVRHILFKTTENMPLVDKNKVLDRANDIKKKLDAGEDFIELAKKNSEDTESAVRGGDIGFIIKGWMPAEFEKAAFSLPVGDTSKPVETKFGYHIIRIEEKRAQQSLTFDDVKDDLGQYISSQQIQQELVTLVKNLRDKASIQITQ